MFRKIKAGKTSVSLPLFIQDTTSTTGAGLGSLVFNTSNLAAKYRRKGASSYTTITLTAMTVGTWATGGFVSDGGPVTGTYELGVPDAALATGAEWVEIVVYGAANMLPVLIFIELDAVDYQDAVRFGLTALPNASAAANGGLPTVDANNNLHGLQVGTGTGQLNTSGGKVPATMGSTDYSGNTVQTGDAYARLGAPAGASVSADVAAAKASIGSPWQVGTKYGVTVASTDVTGNLAADIQTIKTQAVTCAAGVTVGPFVGNATHAIAVDAGGNVTFGNTTIGVSGDFSATMKTSLGTAVGTAQTGDSYARIGAAGAGLTAVGDTRLARLDADVSSRLASDSYTAPDNTSITAVKAKTDNLPASPAAVSDIPSAATIAAAVLAAGDVDGFTLEETLKLCLSALAAKLSGAAGTTITIRAADDSKNRITATVDANGNRTAVTLDAAG